GNRGDLVKPADLDRPARPVGALGACLVPGRIGEAGFVRYAGGLVSRQRILGPPSGGAVAALGRGDAVEERSLRQVHGQVRVGSLDPKCPFHSRRRSEGNAGTASPLVLHRGDVVLAPVVSPVERSWIPDGPDPSLML